jgi:predicted O-linked N-acetylglucosamine transferase (SPINDLY family)
MLVLAENVLLDDYWQTGINHILCGESEEAQATWLSPFFDEELSIDEEQISQSLIDYLLKAIKLKISTNEIQNAYEIAKCLYEVSPANINTLLILLDLSTQCNDFTPESLADLGLYEVFDRAAPADIDLDSLYSFLINATKSLTEQHADAYLNLINLVASKVADTHRFICVMAPHSLVLSRQKGLVQLRTQLLQVCLTYAPASLRFTVLCDLAESTIQSRNYQQAILIGEQCYQEGIKLGKMEHLCGSQRLLTALMEAGEWQKIPAIAEQHKAVTREFITNNKPVFTNTNAIINSSYFLNYLYDDPKFLHYCRNAIGDIYSESVATSFQQQLKTGDSQLPKKSGLVRIGYIASTLKAHSVGWLSRWIFSYHDRSRFQIFVYNVGQIDNNSFNRKFFRDKVDVSHYLGNNAEEIAELIRQDEIDILIDLDSLSLTTTYEVMCRKPAPIAVTWLGWDTSGCPEIDYFIADPHVLPANAEEYYRTKIWRLPQTYIAIDGFEVEVPTKRRSDYQLPPDAIVYLCAQKSYKHHPDILRLQMQIIKQVPNSYLLVQLRANPESLMKIYQELTTEVGISLEQLRFIKPDPDEMTHRANLHLADVVLDTFPYNGATTTLETLWMGVPMVTKVGQAFVARNSYAFMQNVGVTEGIAHTDAEYVDWGVRLGTDLALRQQIMGKLLHSRKTSPLWNARSFTQEMENAYLKMWEIYQSQQK